MPLFKIYDKKYLYVPFNFDDAKYWLGTTFYCPDVDLYQANAIIHELGKGCTGKVPDGKSEESGIWPSKVRADAKSSVLWTDLPMSWEKFDQVKSSSSKNTVKYRAVLAKDAKGSKPLSALSANDKLVVLGHCNLESNILGWKRGFGSGSDHYGVYAITAPTLVDILVRDGLPKNLKRLEIRGCFTGFPGMHPESKEVPSSPYAREVAMLLGKQGYDAMVGGYSLETQRSEDNKSLRTVRINNLAEYLAAPDKVEAISELKGASNNRVWYHKDGGCYYSSFRAPLDLKRSVKGDYEKFGPAIALDLKVHPKRRESVFLPNDAFLKQVVEEAENGL